MFEASTAAFGSPALRHPPDGIADCVETDVACMCCVCLLRLGVTSGVVFVVFGEVC